MTPTELKAWFPREHPGWNWDNRCAGAAYQTCVATGRAVQTYPTATAARDASMIVSRDISKAPAGAFHFWEYWARLGGVYQNYGHVGLELGGGWALMSNPEAWDDQWGIVLGVTNVEEWTRRRAGVVTYLGWSHTYGANTASITTGQTAGDNSTPFNPQEDTMTQSIRLNGTHFYAIDREYISHHGGARGQEQADITRQVNSATDELHDLDTVAFYDYLDGMGIPRHVVDVDSGAVFNPESKEFEVNGVWSRAREANEQFGRVLALLSAKK